MEKQADFSIINHGSVYIVRPNHDDAKKHLDEVLTDEALYFGHGVCVEHRYIENFVEALHNDGFQTEHLPF